MYSSLSVYACLCVCVCVDTPNFSPLKFVELCLLDLYRVNVPCVADHNVYLWLLGALCEPQVRYFIFHVQIIYIFTDFLKISMNNGNVLESLTMIVSINMSNICAVFIF